MNLSRSARLFGGIVCLWLSSATASTFTYTITRPGRAAVADAPELADATVYDFFLSTETDIIGITYSTLEPSQDGAFYQHPNAGHVVVPIQPFIDVFPAMEFDSYVTTPSLATTIAFATSLPCDVHDGTTEFLFTDNGIRELCDVYVGDTVNSGPQTDFRFARITVLGDNFIEMDGVLQIAPVGPGVPQQIPFSIEGRGANISGATFVPEPGGSMLFLGLAAILGMARSR